MHYAIDLHREKVSNVHEDQTLQGILGKAGIEIHDEITSTFLFVALLPRNVSQEMSSASMALIYSHY